MTDEESLPNQEVESAEEELQEVPAEPDYKELWLRSQADAENSRKRFEAERLNLLRFGQERLIEELLPVIDNFDRATKAVPADQQSSPWVTGVQYIQKNLMDVLEQQGVAVLKVKEGDAFDPKQHEALSTTETDKVKEDHIAQVISNGYTLHERLIRPAQVIVAKSSK